MMGEIPLHASGSGRPQSLLRECQAGKPSPGIDPHCQQTKIPHAQFPPLFLPASGVSSVRLYSGHIGLTSFFFKLFTVKNFKHIQKHREE